MQELRHGAGIGWSLGALAIAALVVRLWITRQGLAGAGLRPQLRAQWRWYLAALAIPPALLVIALPLPPGTLATVWGDDERFKETYWSRFAEQGWYFAGDGAKRDEDGNIWVLGRVDDVMNVSGHRLSTSEIESALVSHDTVAEAAVVGAADETTGQAVCAFVILREESRENYAEDAAREELVQELRTHVGRQIGPIAKPRQVLVVDELPKTRSGKIMRRLLKDVAEGREAGDATTLADPSVMAQIQAGLKK